MDAKSLLRAKKAEARITHVYAAYNASGVLRCSICAIPVKQWDAHLLTKQHRQSVAREKAQQQKAVAVAAQTKSSKRPLADNDTGSSSNIGESSKRAKVLPPKTQVEPRDDEEDQDEDGPSLPAGFFSSGKRPKSTSPSRSRSRSPDNQGQASAGPSTRAEPTGDTELDDFLSSLNDDAPVPTATTSKQGVASTTTATANGKRKTYKEVIPSQTSYEAAPVRIAPPDESAPAAEEEEPEESEQEKKERLEREEREEIVARLEEEERAQEDADSRVASLKARMEMLKKRREAKSKGLPNTKTKGTNGA
ncbi:uncharacterized protein I303_108633 [Kwoniella dejecticola CBS 10117]|uniref:Zinc finger protein 830 n=1 Tax=Kwoniella dejecticola CBS 10117 TaxID=1296121 RepID=A0A1A5ZWV6_9TREE|nr:zinc finger protein 830 [Kwoniella dejecticola CBS 10117]OBR82283.1 zinc finger protein 830 [Kwoniella dejecticola CBS 10117]